MIFCFVEFDKTPKLCEFLTKISPQVSNGRKFSRKFGLMQAQFLRISEGNGPRSCVEEKMEDMLKSEKCV